MLDFDINFFNDFNAKKEKEFNKTVEDFMNCFDIKALPELEKVNFNNAALLRKYGSLMNIQGAISTLETIIENNISVADLQFIKRNFEALRDEIKMK